MKNRSIEILAVLTVVAGGLGLSHPVGAQIDPTASGSTAKLDYDAGYSHTASFGGGLEDVQQRAFVSGELQYMNGKETAPLAVTYSGGYGATISGSAGGAGLFQHLNITQGYLARRSSITISDNVGYYPQSAANGFSGIPGVGLLPGQTALPSSSVYQLNTRNLTNTVGATYVRPLNYMTGVSLSGNYTILRFPDGGGFDINEEVAQPSMRWRLNARNTASVQYAFTHFSYVGSTFGMQTQSVQPSYTRVWSRRLTTSLSAGPEWVESSDSAIVPSSLGIAGGATASYAGKKMSGTLNYTRSTSAGGNLTTQIGTKNNLVRLDVTRGFGRNLTLSGTASYYRTEAYLQPGVVNFRDVAADATERLGRYVTLSASYSAIEQSSSLATPANALIGLTHVLGFTVAYHPRERHYTSK
jgi:hypothetical protein